LADDARFRAALVDLERGDATSMTERLRTMPDVYPHGDMLGEAHFLLAWRARTDGRRDDALAELDAALRNGTGEEAEDIHGRAAYWRACVLSDLNRTDEARNAWMAIVQERPLSYYSQQSIARLTELNTDAGESARRALGARGDARVTFAWRSEMDTPAFARAVELLRVGEIDSAQLELAWVYRTSEHQDAELRWIEAALLDRAGAYPQSVALARRQLNAFMQEPPSGEHFARWRIAYPRAYAELIEHAATERALPPELVLAIAREESSFRPDAVSVAHAYGLVQLIVPTARRFGQPLGLRATADSLVDPTTNVAIGTEFMGWLWQRYAQNPAVLPSAYNAGQAATDRWLRERAEQRLDEWIEEIPYDETRRYSRRVLQSWGIYAWLDRGELPMLRATLPPAP
jgi:soluble lytic murein transglycosylase